MYIHTYIHTYISTYIHIHTYADRAQGELAAGSAGPAVRTTLRYASM